MDDVGRLTGDIFGWLIGPGVLTAVGLLLAAFILLKPFRDFVLRVFIGAYFIPEDSIGIVTADFILFRKHKQIPDGRIVALRGEAGLQGDTLSPGFHWGYWVWQFKVKIEKFFKVPEGHIGLVEAIDGTPIPSGRNLAKHVDCDSYQSVRQFVENGGERGPQLTTLPPGEFRINQKVFKVTLAPATVIKEGEVGIITTQEGTPLAQGEIAGARVAVDHRTYQDAQAFVTNGGNKGLQEDPILAGRYYLNPRFAEVERVRMTEVPIGYVGVVVSYVGTAPAPTAQQSQNFRHGTIVSRGEKGVWEETLAPGMYPINPKTHKVELVPTTNIVLNWADAKTASHSLDAGLSTIIVRSADGFTFNLDVSQIIHIPRDKAAAVIARFGTVKNLISQVLEPLIGNYFRNSAQSSDCIDFLLQRAERQGEAKTHINAALTQYDVQAVDTLIGDINPPKELMDTLTERKVAERLKETYQKQKEAQVVRDGLEEATAQANTRAQVVQAERGVEIAKRNAEATVNEAEGEAKRRTMLADADAHVLTVTGEAQAKNTLAVGTASAEVLQKNVNAVGSERYALMQIVGDIANNNVKLVPEILVNGGGKDGGGAGVTDALLAVIANNMSGLNNQPASTPTAPLPAPPAPPAPPQADEAKEVA